MMNPTPSQQRAQDRADWIQQRCIQRKAELGLTIAELYHLCNGHVSEAHIQSYLDRESSMGSHKLQWLLRALRLDIRPAEQSPDK